MKNNYLSAVVVVFGSATSAAGFQPAKSDQELLRGAWVCVVSLKDGQAVDAYVGARAAFEGDNLTWYFPQADGSFREQKNKFRIDPTKNPKTFDWWPVDKPAAKDPRIYSVSPEMLRWGTNLDGKTRPASFETARWQFTMKRLAAGQARPVEIAGWGTVVNPDGDCTVAAAGGKVTITIPGTLHDLFYGGAEIKRRFNAPRVLREVEGDFVARVKVSGAWQLDPAGGYNGAGLVVWDSEKQYLRLERNRYIRTSDPRGPFSYATPLYDRNDRRLNAIKTPSVEFFTGPATWLRLERAGDKITTAISHDGQGWVETGGLATEFPQRVQVGVLAINSSPLGFTATFEDFKVLKE